MTAASVVVTLAFVAASVGRAREYAAYEVAVPEPAVAESVKVCAEKLRIEPEAAAGVPDFPPEVTLSEIAAEETSVVAAAASSVIVWPSQSKPPVSGEIKLMGLFRMLLISALRSEDVRSSEPHVLTLDNAISVLQAHRADFIQGRDRVQFQVAIDRILNGLQLDRAIFAVDFLDEFVHELRAAEKPKHRIIQRESDPGAAIQDIAPALGYRCGLLRLRVALPAESDVAVLVGDADRGPGERLHEKSRAIIRVRQRHFCRNRSRCVD